LWCQEQLRTIHIRVHRHSSEAFGPSRRTADVIPFPAAKLVPALAAATEQPIATARPAAVTQPRTGWALLRQRLSRWWFRNHKTGAIQEIELDESLTGQRLSVWVGEHYVRLCVDGQDYYFDRVTGQFDGIGATR
jgi:hypothetical protein